MSGPTATKQQNTLLSSTRFWFLGALLLLIVFVHLVMDHAQDAGSVHAPGYVWILFLLIPTVYAGMCYGLRGSLTAALAGIAAVLVEDMAAPQGVEHLWGVWSSSAAVLTVAVLVGTGVDRERRLKMAMLQLERERILGSVAGQPLSWRHLFDGLPAGVVLVDQEGRIQDANHHLVTLSDYSRDDLIGQRVELLVPEQLRTRHVRHRGALPAQPIERTHGLRRGLQLQRRDGHEVPVDISLIPLKGTSAQIALILDDTARVEAERAREAAEQHLRLAFENNVAGMAIADPSNRLLDINPAYCAMLGVARGDAIGRNLLEFTHPDDRAITEEWHRLLLAGEVLHASYAKRYLRSDGCVVHAQLLTGLVRDRAGNPEFLVASVRDVTEEHTLAAQLSHQARHDPLTGLPNRTLFEERLAHASACSTEECWCTLVLLDLDDFKAVNDALGHTRGNELLIECARRLSDAARPGDMVCRPGDDEFLYFADDLSSAAEAESLARKLLTVFLAPVTLGEQQITQRASAGAVIVQISAASRVEILQNSDTALAEAKRQGKGQLVIFQPEMRHRVSSRFALLQDLRQALSAEELTMHYQPLVALRIGRVVGCEALMRWQHHVRGAIPPTVFIPLAEQNGLIDALGRYALTDAVACAASWEVPDSSGSAPYVAVNLSGRQFHDPKLASTVEAALDAAALPSARLVVEITESAALADLDRAQRTAKELRRLGVALALDDFGTGYSSLSYLARLQPDIVKIDRSFVSPDVEQAGTHALLAGIVSLAHELEMMTVAEGVETPEQLERVRAVGCDVAQGFLFSRPMPARDLPGLLTSTWDF